MDFVTRATSSGCLDSRSAMKLRRSLGIFGFSACCELARSRLTIEHDSGHVNGRPKPSPSGGSVAMNEWSILVISSGARDLAFSATREEKDFSPEFILSEVEGDRHDNCVTVSWTMFRV